MKKSILCLSLIALICGNALAQNKSNLSISVYVADMVEPFPITAKTQVENKLLALLTQNGLASTSKTSQFVMTAMATPLSKDVLPGPPMQISEHMEITFYIFDAMNEKIFASTSITAKGVGITEDKSYMDAIRRINLNSPALKNLVAEGKTKIIDYYNSEADKMFAKARSLARQHNYEEAFYILSCIPTECNRYNDALAVADEIFVQYNTHACNVNLAEARSAWVSGQNSAAADAAGYYLAQIYPDAGCYAEAMKLYEEIRGKVLDDWHFEMKKYDDSVKLEQARIEAWRAVGVAYGQNQPDEKVNIEFLHR